ASVAALTAPTSPRTLTVTYPAPINSLPVRTTFAVFTMASAASIAPTRPFVSTRPRASISPPVLMKHLRPNKPLPACAQIRPTLPEAAAPAPVGRDDTRYGRPPGAPLAGW